MKPRKEVTFMRKVILLVAFAFAMCATAAWAGTSPSRAEQSCRAQQSDPNFAAKHGGKTFEQFYGNNKNGEDAFGECVSDQTQSSSASSQSTGTQAPATNASQEEQNESSTAEANEQSSSTSATESQEEQNESSAAEANEHSTGPNPESTQAHHAKPTFAAACRAQRSANPAAFEAKYGSNRNKENAMGRCVSAMAKAQASH
jgi:cobalamin biosynthesis protein CobT